MKRWILLILATAVVATGFFALYGPVQNLLFPTPPRVGLMRTPNSAYKYDLCTEAYAFARAASNNPYKTDYSFLDPFRKVEDTIVPRLMSYDAQTKTVSFDVDISVNHVANFHESISQVHELDGISVMLPDAQNHLQHSGIPQFIISSLGTGTIAVLDYTCPNQWVWKQ